MLFEKVGIKIFVVNVVNVKKKKRRKAPCISQNSHFHQELMRLYSETSSQEISLMVSHLICDWSKCNVRAETGSVLGDKNSSYVMWNVTKYNFRGSI